MTGPRTLAPVLQMVHLQIGCLEHLRRHFQLEATHFIGGLWPPKSHSEGGGCQKSEARPTALPGALGAPQTQPHTQELTYRSFWHFLFSTTRERWTSPQRGAMALAPQRSLERWFCKTGTGIDLSFATVGTAYLLPLTKKHATLTILTPRKGEVEATRTSFDLSRGQLAPGSLRFHNRRYNVFANPSEMTRRPGRTHTSPDFVPRDQGPWQHGPRAGWLRGPSSACPQGSHLSVGLSH